jgi:hypothetical protein
VSQHIFKGEADDTVDASRGNDQRIGRAPIADRGTAAAGGIKSLRVLANDREVERMRAGEGARHGGIMADRPHAGVEIKVDRN